MDIFRGRCDLLAHCQIINSFYKMILYIYIYTLKALEESRESRLAFDSREKYPARHTLTPKMPSAAHPVEAGKSVLL